MRAACSNGPVKTLEALHQIYATGALGLSGQILDCSFDRCPALSHGGSLKPEFQASHTLLPDGLPFCMHIAMGAPCAPSRQVIILRAHNHEGTVDVPHMMYQNSSYQLIVWNTCGMHLNMRPRIDVVGASPIFGST